MKLGILGLPSSGKTSLFNLLTGGTADTTPFGSGKRRANLAVVKVPDDRLDRLAAFYRPKKITPVEIAFVDPGGLPGADRSGERAEELLPHLRDADALVLVLRDFESEIVPAPGGRVDPLADLDEIRSDLIVADLATVEKKLERLEKEKKGGDPAKQREYDLFARARDCLESERRLYSLDLTRDEEKTISNYGFLTRKAMILLRNTGDGASPEEPEALRARAEHMGAPLLSMNALLEREVLDLAEEERAEFYESFDIEGGGRERFIRAAFDSLDLISFFTGGERDCHAWTVRRGSHAPVAAGKIHSDMEKGFIRAEVIPVDDLIALGGEKGAREKGKIRTEGKEYVVRDGDFIIILFN
ncbi:MAG: redox-regulated ATPase YchF [Candidatus Eisenbacteria bacterium]|nr:redox-regulated ATPase YchF [Candidatus Eisenbacteria bacterium]